MKAFCQIFKDLEKKCAESEISEKALDLGNAGCHPPDAGQAWILHKALDMGIVNKSFLMNTNRD